MGRGWVHGRLSAEREQRLRSTRPQRSRWAAAALILFSSLAASGTASAAAYPPHNTLANFLIQNGTGTASISCRVDYQHGNYLGTAYVKTRKSSVGPALSTASTTPAGGGVRYLWDQPYYNIVGTPSGYGPYRCMWHQNDLQFQYNGQNYLVSSSLQFGSGFVQATGPVVSYIIASQVCPGGGQTTSQWGYPRGCSGWFPGF